ncbi:MAG TPA: peptidoglycan DD-metalloendopeptidase family protein, partial [Candidatus Limnocylindrales bacterium]|nr:peptidoglycan DD-metalloendopeptidase family protein [Candidatus Limnocylindrales bacterium]
LAELRQAEAMLQSALAVTASQLDEINADLTLVRSEVVAATTALQAVEARYTTLVAELEHLDWTVGVLEEELDQAEEDLEQRKRLLGQRLAEAYQVQQTSLLEQVIGARSFTDVLANVGAHLRFGNQDAELAAQIQRDERSLEALRRTTAAVRYRTDQVRLEVREQALAIGEQRTRLEAAQEALEALEAETKRIQEEQLSQFREVEASREATEQMLLQQRTAQVRLRGEIERLIEEQRQLHRIPSHYNGTLVWPLRGRVTQEFGCTGFPWEPPLGRCAHFHRGIDLVAPRGTDIVSAGDGVVVFVGYNPYDRPGDRAWIVLVAHATNLVTWYGHLQPRIPPGIAEGAHVRAGQVIGWEGNTGHSTGPHLHWGVQLNDRFVNPRLFV